MRIVTRRERCDFTHDIDLNLKGSQEKILTYRPVASNQTSQQAKSNPDT